MQQDMNTSQHDEENRIMLMKTIESLEKERQLLKMKITQLEQDLQTEKQTSHQYLYELTETRKSFTYKIGRVITWIPRKIRNH